MSPAPILNILETDRLTLRRQRVSDAAIYRQLWTERDVRVPPHRRINLEGRPTEQDIATRIGEEHEALRPGLLAVERKGTADVIGYCGLVFNGNGPAIAGCGRRCGTGMSRLGGSWRNSGSATRAESVPKP